MTDFLIWTWVWLYDTAAELLAAFLLLGSMAIIGWIYILITERD